MSRALKASKASAANRALRVSPGRMAKTASADLRASVVSRVPSVSGAKQAKTARTEKSGHKVSGASKAPPASVVRPERREMLAPLIGTARMGIRALYARPGSSASNVSAVRLDLQARRDRPGQMGATLILAKQRGSLLRK